MATAEHKGTELISAERERQVSQEGWSPEHDDQHANGELALAAVTYALVEQGNVVRFIENPRSHYWPWDPNDFKPFSNDGSYFPSVDRIRCLVKAGALIAAEIDRLQRTKGTP